MSNYYFTKASKPADQWTITLGLFPGYRFAKSAILRAIGTFIHRALEFLPGGQTLRDGFLAWCCNKAVTAFWAKWRLEKAKAKKEFITGFVDFTPVHYTFEDFQDGWLNASEPVAVLTGERSPLYHLDEQVYRENVLELASLLGERLKQFRVYVTVMGESIILERNETELEESQPAGD